MGCKGLRNKKCNVKVKKKKMYNYPCNRPGMPEGCGTMRLPHFLDIQPIDGAEVFSLMCWLPFTCRNIPDSHFC
jgi:hypothetical protein